jgi:hypothetical protein
LAVPSADTKTYTLSIQYGRYPADSADAVVPLEVIDERLDARRDLLRLGTPTEMLLPAGDYQVRCTLPSGEIISRQTRVGAGQPNRVELVPRRPSPREELTWAYSLRPSVSPVARQRDVFGQGPLPIAPALSFSLWPYRPEGAWDELPAVKLALDQAVAGDDPTALGTLKVPLPHFAQRRGPMKQYWLRAVGPKDWSRFVALPLPPLPAPPTGAPLEVRVLVVRNERPGARPNEPGHPAGDPIALLVKAGQAAAQMLLGFLAGGDFGAARQVGEAVMDHAENFLKDKEEDPSSAAIGGYYLLKAGELERLHDWTRNLADWFPWMADGAVIHAWHLLRRPKPDIERARQRLLEAVRRGLPLFTEGLRLLYDGLDFFASQKTDDVEVAHARDRVRRYARACTWHSQTTCFYAKDPTKPLFPTGF